MDISTVVDESIIVLDVVVHAAIPGNYFCAIARDDVVEECNKHGAVMHIYVDKASPQGKYTLSLNVEDVILLLTPGNVYVKCVNVSTAVAAVNALHGRWFAGS